MKIYDAIIINFGEIWLKGHNRSDFINLLFNNINSVINTNKTNKYKLEKIFDRFIIYLNKDSDIDFLSSKLKYVFGISWFAPCIISENNLNKIIKAANKFKKLENNKVKIIAHRSYKNLEFNSIEIIKYFILNQKKLKFELDLIGEKILYINPTQSNCFLSIEKIHGLNGLPVSSSGNGVVLFSGGIDSPVASFYAMKRGLKLIFIHFHAFANNQEAEDSEKMQKLITQLKKFENPLKIYYLPSYLFQAATLKIRKKYEHVLFKRFLFEIAKKIAIIEDAKVIVTGESLGQVSSQTTPNLIASEPDTDLLIIRPLIGFDKQEIIDKAKQINTYDSSILKYKDVCSIIVKNPSTNIKKELIDKFYKNSKLIYIADKTFEKAKYIEY